MWQIFDDVNVILLAIFPSCIWNKSFVESSVDLCLPGSNPVFERLNSGTCWSKFFSGFPPSRSGIPAGWETCPSKYKNTFRKVSILYCLIKTKGVEQICINRPVTKRCLVGKFPSKVKGIYVYRPSKAPFLVRRPPLWASTEPHGLRASKAFEFWLYADPDSDPASKDNADSCGYRSGSATLVRSITSRWYRIGFYLFTPTFYTE